MLCNLGRPSRKHFGSSTLDVCQNLIPFSCQVVSIVWKSPSLLMHPPFGGQLVISRFGWWWVRPTPSSLLLGRKASPMINTRSWLSLLHSLTSLAQRTASFSRLMGPTLPWSFQPPRKKARNWRRGRNPSLYAWERSNNSSSKWTRTHNGNRPWFWFLDLFDSIWKAFLDTYKLCSPLVIFWFYRLQPLSHFPFGDQGREMFAAWWMLEGRMRKGRKKAEGWWEAASIPGSLLCSLCLCF